MLNVREPLRLYENYPKRVSEVRRKLGGRPLTQAEKIFYSHLDDLDAQSVERGKSFLQLRPDRVAMQDATAQMALLQFIASGMERAAVPVTIHCDHLILAKEGAQKDLEAALSNNKEVYDFLSTAAKKYGMGFWRPGSGIIHQVILENYAYPGGLLIGTDSHTPNAGGMGMAAVGVGGADAVDVMVGMPWELLCPKLLGVKLTGSLSGWSSGKDVILRLLEKLTTKGGTNKVVEYFGEGVKSLSLTARATVTNMGAELGATTSLFPVDERTFAYLKATRREKAAAAAAKIIEHLNADPEVGKDPARYYDELVEIHLSELEPIIVGPHSPDVARPLSRMKQEIEEKGFPRELKVALIGSCTNSSYEDITRASEVAKQALSVGLKTKVPLLVTPGSDQVYATLERDGVFAPLKAIGATILANACGPCIGQWQRTDVDPQEAEKNPTAIVTSFNRNFRGRNDGIKSTMAFITSPEVVVALALAGRLDFDPAQDTLEANGTTVRLTPPKGLDLPPKGFAFRDDGYQEPAKDGRNIRLTVDESSERLQLLKPFEPWDGKDIRGARILVKAKGKCTTDHISPAGKWLRYRGHLDKISDNLFSGAVNAFTGETGVGKNLWTGETGVPFSKIARMYRAKGIPWVVFGDENYGEGSSREHAALEVRHLGGRAVIVKSFARIHETNLKKQGVLALTFSNPGDYEKVREEDTVDILGLQNFSPGKPLKMILHHQDGSKEEFLVQHSYSADQIQWFKEGGALNKIRQVLTTPKKSFASKKKISGKVGRKIAARSKKIMLEAEKKTVAKSKRRKQARTIARGRKSRTKASKKRR